MTVELYPGDNIQTAAISNPEGALFHLNPGLYRGQQITPKNGQQFHGAGAILDGEGKPAAFAGTARDVAISGLEILGYKPPSQTAAVRGGVGWTLSQLTVHHVDNWAVGLHDRQSIFDCHIHHAGTVGICGEGDDAVIHGCLIEDCNTQGVDSHWEAGGIKLVRADRTIIRGNTVLRNDGPGIWSDNSVDDLRVEANTVEDNQGPGICHEISGAAVICGNDVNRNGLDPNWADDYSLGGGGIYIINSAGVTVEGNRLRDNQGGVGLVNANRPGHPSLQNVAVYGNRVRQSARRSGLAADVALPDPASVAFRNNTWEIDPQAALFRWAGASGNFAWWQARTVGETFGLVDEEPEPVVRPAAPTGLSVARMLLWAAQADADLYRVEYRPNKLAPWVLVAETDDHALAVAERGRYRVRAINQAGVSGWRAITA